MPKVTHIQSAFTSGEVSPRLEGRVDLDIYGKALKTCQNFIVYLHGGVTKRTGTYYVAATKDSGSKTSRLIPFEFSTTQTYVIEAGNLYMRFFKDQAVILNASGVTYTLTTPYLEADIFQLKYAQDADTMYIVHPTYAPYKLTRTGHATWTITKVTFLDGPYLDENATATTLTPSATTGSITVTASADLFVAAHIGGTWRIKDTTWGDFTINTLGSPTARVANCTVNNTLGGVNAVATWRKAAWDGVEGYPGAVAFYEQRLVFSGSTEDPQNIWGSVSGDYENFSPSAADGTVADDDAYTYTIAGQQVNALRWLEPGSSLVSGTTGGVWRVRATDDAPLTATNVNVKRENNYGSANIQPVTVGQSVLYVQRMAKKLRELRYDWNANSYASKDLTVRSEHITGTGNGIVDMALQTEPDPIVWCVRADGQLLGCTYSEIEKVVAWHRHTTAADGEFESVCVIPGDTRDEVWVIVKRTINGSDVRFVEYFQQPYVTQTEQYFVDCGLTGAFGSDVAAVSGLDHLVGETVQVLVDGAVQTDKVVSTAGAITLDPAGADVHVGLGITAALKTMRIEPFGPENTAQGQLKRIVKVIVRLYNSAKSGIEIGPSSSITDPTFGRTPLDEMDAPPDLVTEDVELNFPGDYETAGEIYLTSTQPVGMTLLAIIAELNMYGEQGGK